MILPELLRFLGMTTLLLLISVTDCKTRQIPVYGMVELGMTGGGYLIFACLTEWSAGGRGLTPFFSALFGLLAAALLCLGCRIPGKDSIGGGDIKLLLLLGFCLGIPAFFRALFLTAVFSVCVGAGLLLLRKTKKGDTLPFAPFLTGGTVLALLWQVVETR
ncbi:MAG TPA: A24 family peptidase [Clostridiales bacterium]|nr:A24 family peptidase [Clostridiales bacterium]